MTDFVPKTTYPLVAETISRAEIAALCRWLEQDPTPQLTQGPLVREFEEAFAKHVGAKHAVFCNSGSSANWLAWLLPIVMNRKAIVENPRVICPAVAWPTTVSPAIPLGYDAVLCDAEEETWGLDPVILRKMCEKAVPTMVVLVHMLGVPCKMDEIKALKDEFGFVLIEDACGALGSQPIGTIGDLWTYSTFYGHQLSTIEGGFVCTNDDGPAEILRSMREHGGAWFLSEADQRALAKKAKQDPFRSRFTFYRPGFNMRGTDVHAFLGLGQLKLAQDVAKARQANHEAYYYQFFDSKNFSVQATDGEKVASIGFGVLAATPAHRQKVADALAAKAIATRPVGGGNMARQPFWIEAYGEPKTARPVADRIHDCGFQLPNHPGLTPEDIDFICKTVLSVSP